MKKVVIFLGSPRKDGNSAILAGRLADGVKKEGGKVQTFFVHGMDISPCTGCESCQTNAGSGCVLRDEMDPVYEAVSGSDAIVFASPVYWFCVSAQTKIVLDRLYAIGAGEAGLLKGKSFGIILTYADRDPFVSGAVNAVRMFQDMAAYLGIPVRGIVHGSAYAPGDIRDNEPVMAQACELGRSLAGEDR